MALPWAGTPSSPLHACPPAHCPNTCLTTARPPSRPRRLLGRLTAGQYFGEYSCLLGQPRSTTVVATDYCELYSLSRTDLVRDAWMGGHAVLYAVRSPW